MTEGKDKRQALAQYRLKQAEESLDEARYLLSGNRSPRSVINRTYFAMFYAVLALLIYEPYESSKHSGVLSYFNRRFVKEKFFDKELGRALNKAFELRQRGDYREYVELKAEEVSFLLDKAATFVKTVQDYLSEQDRI